MVIFSSNHYDLTVSLKNSFSESQDKTFQISPETNEDRATLNFELNRKTSNLLLRG